jgi:hypothetical protein
MICPSLTCPSNLGFKCDQSFLLGKYIVTVNITIKWSLLAERNLRMVTNLSTAQVVTCHVLQQVKCTHFLQASTTLFEQKVTFNTSVSWKVTHQIPNKKYTLQKSSTTFHSVKFQISHVTVLQSQCYKMYLFQVTIH